MFQLDIPFDGATFDPRADEEWRVIPGLTSYEVSEIGAVRRCRKGPTNGKVGRTMTPRQDKDGYWTVNLVSDAGEQRPYWVHRLVALAFLGPQPSPAQFCVCHKDGTRTNNHHTNLYWGSPQDNARDTKEHGRHITLRGEDHPFSRLTEDDIRDIRAQYALTRKTQAEIGRQYGISFKTVSKIVNRQRWAHVE